MSFDLPLSVPPGGDRLPELLTRLSADRRALDRQFPAPHSAERGRRLRRLYRHWHDALAGLSPDSLSRDDQLDRWLGLNWLDRELRRLDLEEARLAELAELLPFAPALIALADNRRLMVDLEPRGTAALLAETAQTARALAAGTPSADASAILCDRAARLLKRLLDTLGDWHTFHQGYQPLYAWWCAKPYEALREALGGYAEALSRHAGTDDANVLLGDPVGRQALVDELAAALLPYTPEELVAVGREQMAWCTDQLRAAAAEMGLGDDWRAALERVKADHADPGDQAALVRDLAREAIAWVEQRDLITVPDGARDGWRLEMMSAERQKVNPFFLGGETIIVSFPTDEMGHEAKLMSLRGNNRHFARATVHHELIPGHWLQAYYQERCRPYRRMFYNPFWVEGWPLHWEMLLWDQGFAQSPENRVGMLFWRLHRAARIVFSLEFHLGLRSAEDCVTMLVEEVGHEPDNARGEVRRSFGGDYDALYQAAYLLGGFQVRRLYDEALAAGYTPRRFHDAFLAGNLMPIPAVRAALLGLPLSDAVLRGWRFLDPA